MYGLVNQGIQDLALQLGGAELWARIKVAAGVEHDAFVSMGTYPDELTFRLADAASKVTGLTQAEVLQAFGRHWVLYTARRGYGPILDLMGHTLPEFLNNLDAMHARLSLGMPELRPPSFVCECISDDTIRIEYRSHRDGLAPMVMGLLTGLGELFALDLTVRQTGSRQTGRDHDEFIVEYKHSQLAPAAVVAGVAAGPG